MPRIYVAFMQNGARVAASSSTNVRKKVEPFKSTEWLVYLYEMKSGVETFCTLIEGDITKWGSPKLIEGLRVNEEGKVRRFDPSKNASQ